MKAGDKVVIVGKCYVSGKRGVILTISKNAKTQPYKVKIEGFGVWFLNASQLRLESEAE